MYKSRITAWQDFEPTKPQIIMAKYPGLSKLEKIVKKYNPFISEIIEAEGDLTVEEYIQKIFKYKIPETINNCDDVAVAVNDYASEIYGSAFAKHIVTKLRKFPILNTGNHEGLQTDAPTFHWLIFNALGERNITSIDNLTKPVSLVAACGNIPMDNATKPMSIITNDKRLNIFTNKYAHIMTHFAPPFTSNTIDKVINESKLLPLNNVIEIVLKLCKDPEVLKQCNYINQAALVNSRMWKLIFAKNIVDSCPDMAFLEQEEITIRLLKKDLQNPSSFIYQLLFNNKLRPEVIKSLDGIRGCWNNKQLQQLAMSNNNLNREDRKELAKKSMTHFFWGISDNLTSYPLSICQKGGCFYLRRIDELGISKDILFTPKNVLSLLEGGSIVPSLFINMAVIHFARGITCLGGFNQVAYLAKMKEGLIKALSKIKKDVWIQKINYLRNYSYLLNLPLLLNNQKGTFRHAGPLELIDRGGITNEEIQKMKSIPIKILHLISLPSITPIISNEVIDKELLNQAYKEVMYLKKYIIWI